MLVYMAENPTCHTVLHICNLSLNLRNKVEPGDVGEVESHWESEITELHVHPWQRGG